MNSVLDLSSFWTSLDSITTTTIIYYCCHCYLSPTIFYTKCCFTILISFAPPIQNAGILCWKQTMLTCQHCKDTLGMCVYVFLAAQRNLISSVCTYISQEGGETQHENNVRHVQFHCSQQGKNNCFFPKFLVSCHMYKP